MVTEYGDVLIELVERLDNVVEALNKIDGSIQDLTTEVKEGSYKFDDIVKELETTNTKLSSIDDDLERIKNKIE